MSHESKLQPCQSSTRPDVLEVRLSSQDKTLAVLLEQAFQIKEEVAAGLQSNRHSVQVEVHSRKLLENHILTITHIVKQLSMEIQAVERHIAQRDSITSGTTLAVQNLDQKNMAVIGDLRGRVARCDASIAKLSDGMSSGEQQVIRLQQEVAQLRAAVDTRLKALEVKLHHDLGKMEASLTKHSQDQRSSLSDLQRDLKLLEDRMLTELKEGKNRTEVLRKWTEEQLNSSIQTHAQSSQQLRSLLQDKVLEAETKLAARLHALEGCVEQFETRWNQSDRSPSDQLKRSEAKLSKRMTSVEISLHRELQLLKQEYHKGFLSVHDAIESLQQISDIKSRLNEEKLQKHVRHICSKVTELSEK
ncbi:protein FAM81B [Parambassis ranga]|uniref:Protein FAM81B n=1 Tax=Parambassis ranga TaxID=210632 RepID=A0A6P7IZC3_9TELE|nr:protein FAM81B [Parambassis ranga]